MTRPHRPNSFRWGIIIGHAVATRYLTSPSWCTLLSRHCAVFLGLLLLPLLLLLDTSLQAPGLRPMELLLPLMRSLHGSGLLIMVFRVSDLCLREERSGRWKSWPERRSLSLVTCGKVVAGDVIGTHAHAVETGRRWSGSGRAVVPRLL